MFRRKRKKGQALVEMAMVFPFFLLIIVGGLIDFGFAFYNYLTLQQIANDVAQWAAESNGSIGQPESSIGPYAFSQKPSWWTGNFTVHPPQTIQVSNNENVIKIGMTYESPTYTPFYQIIFKAGSGSTSIKLSTIAAYKIPAVVFTRGAIIP